MSIGETLLGAGLPLVGDAYSAVRREYARRLQDGNAVVLASLDAELDEALDILAQDAATPLGTVQAAIRGLISRPDLFRHPKVGRWISTELARNAVKGAVIAYIRSEPVEPYAEQALTHFTRFDEVDDGLAVDGDTAWNAACAYVMGSLQRELSPGDKILLTTLHGIDDKLGQITRRPGALGVYDDQVDQKIDWLRRRRFFSSARTAEEAGALGEQLMLMEDISPPVRARALAWCARWVSQSDMTLARQFLSQAEALGGSGQVEIQLAAVILTAKTDGPGALARIDIEASPLHATTALQFLRIDRDNVEALDLAERAGIGFDRLDADGRYVLIASQVDTDRWDDALKSVRQLSDIDYAKTPGLLWIAATVIVAASLAPELKPGVVGGLPLHPARFPLPEDRTSLEERRVAADLTGRVAAECDALGLPREASNARRFQLWLRLRDPDSRLAALDALKTYVRDPSTAVEYLPLALDFDVGIDAVYAEKQLDRYIARRPDGDPEWALARFSLILSGAGADVEGALKALRKHRPLLARYLDRGLLLGLEMQFLIELDRTEEVHSLLGGPEGSAVPWWMQDHLKAKLGSIAPPGVEELEAAYAKSRRFSVLVELVDAHQAEGFSEAYLQYARELVSMSRKAEHARSITDFLLKSGRHDAAAKLLSDNLALTNEFPDLLSRYAWLAFEDGRLAEAEEALAKVEAARDEAVDRHLRYALLVASGRWSELEAFVDKEWSRRDQRSGHEIGRLAVLASNLESRRTRDLIDLAVERGPDDPEALLAAYNAATRAGLEDVIEDAGRWIMQAAQLSDGEDGPVYQASIETLLSGREEWEKRVEEAWRLLAEGTLPLQGAAMMLRRPWLELQVLPMLANERVKEPRSRSIVPLFGGKREPTDAGIPPIGTIALDRAAIMTLATLHLLDPVLAACDDVMITHDTLTDLFDQRQRLAFHQPSKIAFARQLTGLIGKGVVQILDAAVSPDHGLMLEVGSSLAALLQEASSRTGQHLVVHPFPVTRAGSLLRETVDLSAFANNLVSCSAVVDHLRRDGRITRGEVAKARSYLDQHDQPWPDEPSIREGATLYLSDLAVAYLRYTGILEKIVAASIHIVVSASEAAEARALLDHDTNSVEMSAIIDASVRSLAAALAQRRVRLDAVYRSDEEEDERDTLIAVTQLAGRTPVLVSDDRFLNQYDLFETPSGVTRILTTLQLCETLAATGRLDPDLIGEIRTRLRRMGAMCVPLDAEELTSFLSQAEITDEGLQETGELRALRENVRLLQLRGWLNPKADALWLLKFGNALTDAIGAQWDDDIDDATARIRSRWLLNLLDLRDWTDIVASSRLDGLVASGAVLMFAKLAMLTFNQDGETRDRFGRWLEDDVARPLWAKEPGLREPALAHLRGVIHSADHESDTRALGDMDPALRRRFALSRFPDFLQVAMAEDEDFSQALGLETTGRVTLGSGEAEFDRAEFFDAVVEVYSHPAATRLLADLDAREWRMSAAEAGGEWPVMLELGDRRHLLHGVHGLHPDPEARLKAFERAAAKVALPTDSQELWRDRLRAGPLGQLEIDTLNADLADTPFAMMEMLEKSLRKNRAPLELLVPASERYYRRLIFDNSASTLATYVSDVVRAGVAGAVHADPQGEGPRALLLASHPEIVAVTGLSKLPSEALEKLGRWALGEGDLLAQVGFIEAALERAHETAELESLLIALISGIETLPDADEDGRLGYLSALFVLIDGELSRNQAMRERPPFMRRIAAFAQAALIERVTSSRIERGQFAKAAVADRGWHFVVQTLVDLRREPRWRPDYVLAAQLKNEFIGRIVNRAAAIGPEVMPEALSHLIFGEEEGCLSPRERFPQTNWAGPIEGAPNDMLSPPYPDIQERLDEGLSRDDVQLADLYGLVNANELFKLPPAMIDAFADRVRQQGWHLLSVLPPSNCQDAMAGLAHVAASNRHKELAHQVRILARRRRAAASPDVAFEDEIYLAFVAAAAEVDEDTWARALGDWLLELAVTANAGMAARLIEWIDRLCALEPFMRAHTGRARAALALVNGN